MNYYLKESSEIFLLKYLKCTKITIFIIISPKITIFIVISPK